jgi:sugar lactone lactonase YvrE
MTPQPGLDPHTLAQLRRQFEQEAMVLARLNHPHLVRVGDFFEEGSNAYLVMDFVAGENLAERIERQGALPEAAVLAWAEQLLDALGYCHAQGILHRDVKPQNVIITPSPDAGEGRGGAAPLLIGGAGEGAVLVDFGLVKLWDPHDPRTKTALRGMGTPEYAPPEQYSIRGQHTDPRSDVYGLGATLYHALTGQAPLSATDRMAMPDDFLPPSQVMSGVNMSLEAAILTAMSLPLNQRWASAAEMRAALRAPVSPPKRTRLMGEAAATPAQGNQDSVAALYQILQGQMTQRDWEEAERTAQALELLRPGYQNVAALLRQAQDNQAGRQEAEETWQRLNAETGDEAARLSLERDALEQQMQALDSERSAMDAQQATLEQQRADLQAQLATVEQELSALAPQRTALEEQVQETDRRKAVLLSQEQRLAARQATLAEAQQLLVARRYREARQRLQIVTLAGGLTEEQISRLGEIRRLEHPRRGRGWLAGKHSVLSVAFCPKPLDTARTLLASATQDGRSWLWCVDDGTLLRVWKAHAASVWSVAFSPDGEMLASASSDKTVRLWRVSDGALLRPLARHTDNVWSVTFSPDGVMLASGSDDNTVRLWRVSDGALLGTLKGHRRGVRSVAFSPDGATLASGSDDSTVWLRRVSNGSLLHALKGGAVRVWSVAFSPDGEVLASGSSDSTVRLWRVSDGALLRTLAGHACGVRSVAFSPNGAILASGASDSIARLWRVSDGTLLRTLKGHTDEVRSVTFSPDGAYLASAADDGTVRLWGVVEP